MRQLIGGMSGGIRRGRMALFGMLGLFAGGLALAHHSFTMYDNDHQIKLSGTVTSFDWNNPHVYIELASSDEQGATHGYTVECASPGILNRIGWKFNMIKRGDKITVIIAPLKTGEPGWLLKQITLADGRVFSNGAPAGKPNVQ